MAPGGQRKSPVVRRNVPEPVGGKIPGIRVGIERRVRKDGSKGDWLSQVEPKKKGEAL